MSDAPVRLRAPLPCWHESLASARTDPLVSLSLSGGIIQTSRPVPAGTPLFLEIATDSNGAPKAEVDAVAVSVDDEGFAVRFVGIDERARTMLERVLDHERAAAAAAALAAAAAAPPASQVFNPFAPLPKTMIPPSPPTNSIEVEVTDRFTRAEGPSSLPGALPSSALLPSKDETQPFIVAKPAPPAGAPPRTPTPPPQPLQPPSSAITETTGAWSPPPALLAAVENEVDETRPWAKAPAAEAQVESALAEATAKIARLAEPPSPELASLIEESAKEPPVNEEPSASALDEPTLDARADEHDEAPGAALHRTATPLDTPSVPATMAPPSLPLPKIATVEMPGGPPPRPIEETMRWPTSSMRVVDPPAALEPPPAASEPLELEPTHTEPVEVGDAGDEPMELEPVAATVQRSPPTPSREPVELEPLTGLAEPLELEPAAPSPPVEPKQGAAPLTLEPLGSPAPSKPASEPLIVAKPAPLEPPPAPLTLKPLEKLPEKAPEKPAEKAPEKGPALVEPGDIGLVELAPPAAPRPTLGPAPATGGFGSSSLPPLGPPPAPLRVLTSPALASPEPKPAPAAAPVVASPSWDGVVSGDEDDVPVPVSTTPPRGWPASALAPPATKAERPSAFEPLPPTRAERAEPPPEPPPTRLERPTPAAASPFGPAGGMLGGDDDDVASVVPARAPKALPAEMMDVDVTDPRNRVDVTDIDITAPMERFDRPDGHIEVTDPGARGPVVSATAEDMPLDSATEDDMPSLAGKLVEPGGLSELKDVLGKPTPGLAAPLPAKGDAGSVTARIPRVLAESLQEQSREGEPEELPLLPTHDNPPAPANPRSPSAGPSAPRINETQPYLTLKDSVEPIPEHVDPFAPTPVATLPPQLMFAKPPTPTPMPTPMPTPLSAPPLSPFAQLGPPPERPPPPSAAGAPRLAPFPPFPATPTPAPAPSTTSSNAPTVQRSITNVITPVLQADIDGPRPPPAAAAQPPPRTTDPFVPVWSGPPPAAPAASSPAAPLPGAPGRPKTLRFHASDLEAQGGAPAAAAPAPSTAPASAFDAPSELSSSTSAAPGAPPAASRLEVPSLTIGEQQPPRAPAAAAAPLLSNAMPAAEEILALEDIDGTEQQQLQQQLQQQQAKAGADDADTFFDDMAFEIAQPPPSSSSPDPAAWSAVEKKAPPPAAKQADADDDIPLAVGEELPVISGRLEQAKPGAPAPPSMPPAPAAKPSAGAGAGAAPQADPFAGLWVVGEPAKK